uniref:Uncharacterized protein n=1 Tax=Sus scrofa TaxID=9823 RepID=A0A4X1SMH4_PIG
IKGPDGHLVLKTVLKTLSLKALYSAMHHGTDKMIQIMKKYGWGDCFKVTKFLSQGLWAPSP